MVSAVACLVPAALLALLELALRLGGYGYSTSYFIRSEDGRHFQANRQFGWRFYPKATAIIPNPERFPAGKPTNGVRIFILGESAAAGTPDPAYGFARILRVMLSEEFPGRRFEVINAAMRGIDSHVILPIARDCARHQPDLFILYLGNNEFVRLHAPASDTEPAAPNRRRLRIQQALRTTKVVQWLETCATSLEPGNQGKPANWDMDFFRRHRLDPEDPRKAVVYDNFRGNLIDILNVVRRSGARAIVSTAAVNLRDCPPLGSLHARGLTGTAKAAWAAAYGEGVAAENAHHFQAAISAYEQADRLDPGFAELHFRLAECFLASGQANAARPRFLQARDCDALEFRADSRINEILRRLARGREAEGLYLVDMEEALAQRPDTDDGIPGEALFRDHVHFTFAGDYAVAARLLPAVAVALDLGPPAGPVPSRQHCADRLAYGAWVEADLAEPIVALTGRAPFLDQLDHPARQARAVARLDRLRQALRREDWERAARLHRQAIDRWPDDWQLHYSFGRLLLRAGKPADAAGEFEQTLQLFPKLLPAMLGRGYALLETRRLDPGLACMEQAMQIDPNSHLVRAALAYALTQAKGSVPANGN